MAEWQTQRDVRDKRQQARDDLRRLKIEFADKLWLAQNHPVADSVLVWLSENRAEASKIGASRWNLETLPSLINQQHKLRTAAEFTRILDQCRISEIPQNPQFPQNQQKSARKPRRDAGKARKRPKQTTAT